MNGAPPSGPGESRRSNWRTVAGDSLGLMIALAILILGFSVLTRHFFSLATFRTIANQVPGVIIVATGLTFVLVIAGIDLSVGSVQGLCGAVLGAGLVHLRLPLGLAMLLSIAVGLACGTINGWVTIHWRLPSFIVTLGMLEAARGAAHWVTQSQTQYLGPAVAVVADTSLAGLSLPFLLSIVLVIGGQLVLTRTVFGRYLIAIGTNEEAVRLSGIDPRPLKLTVFVLSSFLVALAAIVDTSRFQSANPNAGTGLELQAIAAVVIGGTSLMGGRGSVVGTFFGVLIIAVMNSGLAAVGAKDETKRIITGAVIVAAVILDQYRHRPGSEQP